MRYLAAQPRDFLTVATPGSGKTAFALRVAGELLADGSVDRITVVVPTEHLKTQWALAAAGVGMALDPKFSNSSAQTSSEYHGVVVTYAQVASHPSRHRVRTENYRTLVVFDEIHHGGDAKSWGEAIREAVDDATRRLALTGTPFRSDDAAIPFVRYEPDTGPDGAGALRSQADHTYGYAEALGDGVVRPVIFLAYSGEPLAQQRRRGARGPLTAERTARAWRTALDRPAGGRSDDGSAQGPHRRGARAIAGLSAHAWQARPDALPSCPGARGRTAGTECARADIAALPTSRRTA